MLPTLRGSSAAVDGALFYERGSFVSVEAVKPTFQIVSFCSGDGYDTPFGCSSTTITDDDRSSALDSMNNMRQDLANGRALDMNLQALPAAKNMYKLLWSCTLEDQSETLAKQCSSSAPSVPTGLGYNYILGSTNLEAQAYQWTTQIEHSTLANPSDGSAAVQEFSNVGCVLML
ncbi:unnamed protein product [Heligmosomoides polygyrus]|uniref:SCP domain-containing protein n=1 Tax=Heligmosomoides polygyrus TaxID=6339 RepID=A0A3P8E516_HELPZ|nr:unnamed protein product [Heligmosomoides polygyrus]